MKILLTIHTILLSYTLTTAQAGFTFWLQDSGSGILRDVIELDGNKYLCLISEGPDATVMVLDQQGAVLTVNEIPSTPDDGYWRDIVAIDSGYMLVGFSSRQDIASFNLYYLKLDQNFATTAIGYYETGISPQCNSPLQYTQQVGNEILVLGTCFGEGVYLARFNNAGELESLTSDLPLDYCGYPTTANIFPDSSSVTYLGDFWVSTIDTAGEKVRRSQSPFGYQNSSYVSPDNYLYGSGRTTKFQDPTENHSIIKYNTSLAKIAQYTFNDTVNAYTTIYPAFYGSVGALPNGDIVSGGTWGIDFSSFESANDSWFHLSRFDTSLHLLWFKKYGGDACYVMFQMITTSDGGVIMFGSRYDENSSNSLDPYLLKVGAEELMNTSAVPNVVPLSGQIWLGPNPGNDLIQIQSSFDNLNPRLEMYAVDNRLVLNTIGLSGTDISVSRLPSGIYFYILRAENGTALAKGKWVKGRE